MINKIGYITLLSEQGFPSQVKRYRDLSHRNSFIKKWIKDYALNNKSYYLVIEPDVEIFKYEIKGDVVLSIGTDDNVIKVMQYDCIERRNEIIAGWFEKHNGKILIIKIIPNE
jgi:hypothetical protein